MATEFAKKLALGLGLVEEQLVVHGERAGLGRAGQRQLPPAAAARSPRQPLGMGGGGWGWGTLDLALHHQ